MENEFFCKFCGEKVVWEHINLLKVERYAYHCSNHRCPFSVWEYRKNNTLPGWVELRIEGGNVVNG